MQRDGISKGFYFSINHKMVSTDKGKEIIKNIPIDRLLTETDAPFTLSEQVKSRTQSLKRTLEGIAIIKKSSTAEMKDIIYNNLKTILV